MLCATRLRNNIQTVGLSLTHPVALNDPVPESEKLRFPDRQSLAGAVAQNFCGQPAGVLTYIWHQGLNPP